MPNVADRNRTPLHSNRGIRFIVADSDRRVCTRLREIIRLESETWRVQKTRCGRETLRVIRAANVDVAILNVDLPDLSGLEVMRSVRREFIRTAFIILAETDCVKTAVRAMKAGARDVLFKPVAKGDLISAINEVLESRYPPRRERICVCISMSLRPTFPGCSVTVWVLHFRVASVITGSRGQNCCSHSPAPRFPLLQNNVVSSVRVDFRKPFADRRELHRVNIGRTGCTANGR